ncbi:hypothetical protein WUBG_03418 [Wuchereria bancrofti]|uniref:Uncharacterized protein n=1 Tax=Wuchereria bancrofti TaxID=6293 RepID=J9EU24_WUCBA|nr:hypothetical protein WUBG_03418 [Wuchereria bancrofti]
MQIPALSRRIRTRMSSDATKCINMETVSVLMKATEEFLRTPDGHPDKTIQHYRPKGQLPEGRFSDWFSKVVVRSPYSLKLVICISANS